MRTRSATALVIANMIGAGIFTTTGFQAADLGHPLFIFVLWIVGGILALLGALCYAELGAMMPRAGAEYVYLRETYGPAIGFMSAFVSLVAGFSAAIATATKEMSRTDTLAAFGTSLIFVMFCYSGWNAAPYVAGEMEDPQRDLPRSLISGTAIVLLLYLGLNAVYLYGASVDELAGQVEVGLVSSRTLFGNWGVSLVTVVLCASILASASAMTVAGPRVYYALGKDFTTFSFLSRTRRTGAPAIALIV